MKNTVLHFLQGHSTVHEQKMGKLKINFGKKETILPFYFQTYFAVFYLLAKTIILVVIA